jgi:hypothetical protein
LTKTTKSYLSITIISIIALIILAYCVFWIGILSDYFLPFFKNVNNKIDWRFVLLLCSTLLLWYLYFSILKSQVRFFTILPEGKEITNRYSLFEFLVYVWLFCIVLSGFLYFLFQDNEHGIDYAIVSFFISAPYLTFRFIKYYVWEKKKTDLKN